mmetsp:Transcript_13485/g.31529  ORF Transcript_13485/g.31529 Transcript_13485/m.31529 type:complete len:106 (-) Transcript_13485:8-325(-)
MCSFAVTRTSHWQSQSITNFSATSVLVYLNHNTNKTNPTTSIRTIARFFNSTYIVASGTKKSHSSTNHTFGWQTTLYSGSALNKTTHDIRFLCLITTSDNSTLTC